MDTMQTVRRMARRYPASQRRQASLLRRLAAYEQYKGQAWRCEPSVEHLAERAARELERLEFARRHRLRALDPAELLALRRVTRRDTLGLGDNWPERVEVPALALHGVRYSRAHTEVTVDTSDWALARMVAARVQGFADPLITWGVSPQADPRIRRFTVEATLPGPVPARVREQVRATAQRLGVDEDLAVLVYDADWTVPNPDPICTLYHLGLLWVVAAYDLRPLERVVLREYAVAV